MARYPKLFGFFGLMVTFTIVQLSVFSERLPVRTFTSADGLGSSFVDYIYRDALGFMWFCTRDGLSRFDGSRFVTYEIGDQAAPPGIEIIFEASDGTYWMSTTGGTYRFDPNRISQPEGDRPRLNAEKITNLRGGFYEDKGGVLWLTSNGLFKYVLTEQGREFVEVPLNLPRRENTSLVAFDMIESADGSQWLQTSWGLVRRLSDGRTVFYQHRSYLPGGSSDTLLDRSGLIWMTIGRDVYVLKPELPESIPDAGPTIIRNFDPSQVVAIEDGKEFPLPTTGGELFSYESPRMIEPFASKRVKQTSDGDIWLSAEKFLLQISNGKLKAYSSAQGLPGVINRIAEDPAGNLWIGGHSLLGRLYRNGFFTFGTAEGIESSRYFSVTEDAAGSLYFGQGEFAIARYDGSEFVSLRPKLPNRLRPMWTSRTVFRSTKGDFWILSADGLFRFRGISDFGQLKGRSPDAIYNSSSGLRSDGAFQIFEDSKGNIWLSTRGNSADSGGLAILPAGEETFVDLTARLGFDGRRAASSFVEDATGNMWFGFYEGGVAKFDGERFTAFDSSNGLPEVGLISDLLVDQAGRLWMSSSTFGVFRLDDVNDPDFRLTKIGTAEGLSSSNVRTLTEDEFGRIYAGTARGVDRISPDTLAIKHFSVTDGLAADFIVDSHRAKNGDLWFVTNNGVSRFVPRIEDRSPPPKVFIGEVRISGIQQPVPQLGETTIDAGELSSSENNVQIGFFGLDFRAGSSLKYQLMLEGADTDWGQPTDVSRITYANLVPGHYIFRVRAVNDEGTASETPATFSFVILRPFWQRWWFVLGVVLLIALAAYLFYRYRTAHLLQVNRALSEAHEAEEKLSRLRDERLRELERIRARIATDLHDDIGSSLTQIAVLSEVAYARSESGNGKAKESLSRITAVSNDLVGTMSDIVWSINPQKDHLSDLTQRMRRFAADVLTSNGIAFRLTSPPNSNELQATSLIRREIFLVFKEAISNIVKHAKATEVTATIAITNGQMAFTVADNGTGFDMASENAGLGGNGLANMRKRAAEMNGSLEVESNGGGTIICLQIPYESSPAAR